jgi:hypothetical protein
MMPLIETILVALILIVEVIDVIRHWNSHEIHVQIADPDCSGCLDSFANSLRKHIGIPSGSKSDPAGRVYDRTSKFAYSLDNSDASTAEDSASGTDTRRADSDADARAARAFLSDPNRHVRPAFDSRWIGLR